MENTIGTNNTNFNTNPQGVTMNRGESHAIANRVYEQEKTAQEPKKVKYEAITPDRKVLKIMQEQDLDTHQVMEKMAKGEFREGENQESSIRQAQDKRSKNHEKISDQIRDSRSKDREKENQEIIIPDGVKRDLRFLEIYAKHAIAAAENGEEINHEEIAKVAYKEFAKELDEQDEKLNQINGEKTRTIETREITPIGAEIERLKAENIGLRDELATARADIEMLKQKMQQIEFVLLFLKKQLEDEEKKKKEKGEDVSILQILIQLITMLMAEILVDDPEERKKLEKIDNPFGGTQNKEDSSDEDAEKPNLYELEQAL